MNYFSSLLTIIITLFLLMVCGYGCKNLGIIQKDSPKHLSRLIAKVGQPMMIIGALNRVPYNEENLTIAWQVTLIGFGVHAAAALLAYFICLPLRKINPERMKIFEFGLVCANSGFIGFPILDSILGTGTGSFMGAFYAISFQFVLWIWAPLILGRGRNDVKLTPQKILFGTLPAIIGLALFLCKPLFELPAFFQTFFDYLGGLCTPISVLITGALIATMPLKKFFTNIWLYAHSFLKLLVFPVIMCVISKLLGMPENYILMITALSGVPSAAMVTMFGELYDIEPAYASQTVGMTSLLSTATLPCVMLFAQWIITL